MWQSQKRIMGVGSRGDEHQHMGVDRRSLVHVSILCNPSWGHPILHPHDRRGFGFLIHRTRSQRKRESAHEAHEARRTRCLPRAGEWDRDRCLALVKRAPQAQGELLELQGVDIYIYIYINAPPPHGPRFYCLLGMPNLEFQRGGTIYIHIYIYTCANQRPAATRVTAPPI